MAVLETAYSVGDVVFFSSTTVERKSHPCPDCLGMGKWKATSPAGAEMEFACPRCSGGYQSNPDLSLDYSAHEPVAQRLTIGLVKASSENEAEYMCNETGVSSGRVYRESNLHSTEAAALEHARAIAGKLNKKTEWIAKQYNRSLRLSDYQMHSAELQSARDQKTNVSVKVQMLFDELRACETIDEVSEVLDGGWPK